MTDFATLARTSPIIVCGNPRSGTRMHANVLNLHPDVLITDEFHDINLIREFLANYRQKRLLTKFSHRRMLERHVFLTKMLWVSYSIDRIAEKSFTARIVGNKTPTIERSYKILENILRAAPPKYVYCLRSAPKVLRSIKNLTNLSWNKDSVETNLERYIRSVRLMEEMCGKFPDRVLVSVIDHLKPDTTNSAFFERVFAFVGVELDDATRRAIDALGSQNTMEAVKKKTGPEESVVELTDQEMEFIATSREYDEIRTTYGLDPI